MKKKLVIIIILLIIIIALVWLFTQDRELAGTEESITILANKQEIVFENSSDTTEYDLESLSLEQGLEIKNTSNSTIYVGNKKIGSNTTIKVENTEIKQDNKIEIEVRFLNSSANTKYYINTLPSNFPEYETTGKSNYDGDYYTTLRKSRDNEDIENYLVEFNEKGEIIFYKKVTNLYAQFNKVKNSAGKIRYTYISKDLEKDLLCLYVLDENYNQIDEITYIMQNGEEQNVNVHDVLYIDDGDYIVATNEKKDVNNIPQELGKGTSANVKACLVEEIQNGVVQWEFDSTDYPEFYSNFKQNGELFFTADDGNMQEQELEDDKYFSDYMHINSFALDPQDGNVICSFRNQSSIIKLNRQTGEIMWTLGGKGDEFGLTDEQKFSGQHSVSYLSDNSILVYDNGLKNGEARVVRIKINEETKTVESYKDWDLGVSTTNYGSVQAVDEDNDVYLLCYSQGDSSGKANIEEKNLEAGKTYFTFQFIGEGNTSLVVHKYE